MRPAARAGEKILKSYLIGDIEFNNMRMVLDHAFIFYRQGRCGYRG
jgi:hypothetical protein